MNYMEFAKNRYFIYLCNVEGDSWGVCRATVSTSNKII